MPNPAHTTNIDTCWCQPRCYHCGRRGERHRQQCPDNPTNRAAMPTMSATDFDKLIPVGTWVCVRDRREATRNAGR